MDHGNFGNLHQKKSFHERLAVFQKTMRDWLCFRKQGSISLSK